MDDNLIKLQHFFIVNQRIKEEMYNSCPPTYDVPQDEESIIKYCDDLYKTLRYILCELKCISSDFFKQEEMINKIDELEKNIINDLMLCNTDIIKLRIFYEKYISDMKPDFVDSVKSECVGYTLALPDRSIKLAETINEILHLFHSYIINNEKNYQSINSLTSKTNEYGYDITLHGSPNALAQSVFENLPNSLDCGWTDIVSLNDEKLIMMVRERGHALTIEITRIGNKLRVEYFVPKLCNIDMINRLPGVNKVEKGDPGAKGIFETENINDLFTFISMVPTDLDMVFDNAPKTL